jgi:hypothetical protein
MDAGASRRAERKERRDRERRRKGAEQSDQAFGGDDVAVRVRESPSDVASALTMKRARPVFPRQRPRGSLTRPPSVPLREGRGGVRRRGTR